MTTEENISTTHNPEAWICRCPKCLAANGASYTLGGGWAELSERNTSNPIVSGAINVIDTCGEYGYSPLEAMKGALHYLAILGQTGQRELAMNPEAFAFWMDKATAIPQIEAYAARLRGGRCEEAEPFTPDLETYQRRARWGYTS